MVAMYNKIFQEEVLWFNQYKNLYVNRRNRDISRFLKRGTQPELIWGLVGICTFMHIQSNLSKQTPLNYSRQLIYNRYLLKSQIKLPILVYIKTSELADTPLPRKPDKVDLPYTFVEPSVNYIHVTLQSEHANHLQLLKYSSCIEFLQ